MSVAQTYSLGFCRNGNFTKRTGHICDATRQNQALLTKM